MKLVLVFTIISLNAFADTNYKHFVVPPNQNLSTFINTPEFNNLAVSELIYSEPSIGREDGYVTAGKDYAVYIPTAVLERPTHKVKAYIMIGHTDGVIGTALLDLDKVKVQHNDWKKEFALEQLKQSTQWRDLSKRISRGKNWDEALNAYKNTCKVIFSR